MTHPPSNHPPAGPLTRSAQPEQAGQPASRQSVEITAKLYEVRDTMERFWGDRFEEKTAEFKPIIEAVMRKQNCSVFVALTEILKTDSGNGMLEALFISAAVEMIEAREDPQSVPKEQ